MKNVFISCEVRTFESSLPLNHKQALTLEVSSFINFLLQFILSVILFFFYVPVVEIRLALCTCGVYVLMQ